MPHTAAVIGTKKSRSPRRRPSRRRGVTATRPAASASPRPMRASRSSRCAPAANASRNTTREDDAAADDRSRRARVHEQRDRGRRRRPRAAPRGARAAARRRARKTGTAARTGASTVAVVDVARTIAARPSALTATASAMSQHADADRGGLMERSACARSGRDCGDLVAHASDPAPGARVPSSPARVNRDAPRLTPRG